MHYTTHSNPQLSEVIDNAFDFWYDKYHKTKICFANVSKSIATKMGVFCKGQFIRDQTLYSWPKLSQSIMIILMWLHFDSPIPKSLYRMRFGQRKTLLEFYIFHLIPSACCVLVVSYWQCVCHMYTLVLCILCVYSVYTLVLSVSSVYSLRTAHVRFWWIRSNSLVSWASSDVAL